MCEWRIPTIVIHPPLPIPIAATAHLPLCAAQIELSHTNDSRNQTCAAVQMLKQLDALGFELRQVTSGEAHMPRMVEGGSGKSTAAGAWRTAPSVWAGMRRFPSNAERGMAEAYERDFKTYSTNLVGRRRAEWVAGSVPPWPLLGEDCVRQQASRKPR